MQNISIAKTSFQRNNETSIKSISVNENMAEQVMPMTSFKQL
jgi:hypothetical protein